jgi:hypothetical protein
MESLEPINRFLQSNNTRFFLNQIPGQYIFVEFSNCIFAYHES